MELSSIFVLTFVTPSEIVSGPSGAVVPIPTLPSLLTVILVPQVSLEFRVLNKISP